MKKHTYLTIFVISMLGLYAGAAAASGAGADFSALATRISEASATTSQSTYSQQLRKSINAAAVRHLEQTCAQKNHGDRTQTFTMMGVMRLDGVLKSPTPLPENAFTTCVAENMDSVSFPLPPGNQRGWPVAIQFDGHTGKVLYMEGDRQPALPQYQYRQRRYTASASQWMYTPVPVVPKGQLKKCDVSVWVSVGGQGRVDNVDVADSSCPSSMEKAVVAAAHQWLHAGVPGADGGGSMDVQLSFTIRQSGVRVSL